VIPSSIRNKLGLSEGVVLIIEIRDSEIILHRIPEEIARESDPDNLENFLTES